MASTSFERFPLFAAGPLLSIERRSDEDEAVVDVRHPDGRVTTYARDRFDDLFAVPAAMPDRALPRDAAVVRTGTPSAGSVRLSLDHEPIVALDAPLSVQAAAVAARADEVEHAVHVVEAAKAAMRASVATFATYVDAAAASALMTCAAAPLAKRAEAISAACSRAAADWAPSKLADRFCRDTGIPRAMWKPVRSYETSATANIASMMSRFASAQLDGCLDQTAVMILSREHEEVVEAAEIWLEGSDVVSNQSEAAAPPAEDVPLWAVEWRRAWFGDGNWSSCHRRFGAYDILVFEMSDLFQVMIWPTEAGERERRAGNDHEAPYLSAPCYQMEIDEVRRDGIAQVDLVSDEGFGTPLSLPWDQFLREFRPFPARVERWIRIQPTRWLDAETANTTAGLVRADRWGRPTIPCALALSAQMFTLRNLGLDENHIGHILAEGDARLLDPDMAEGQIVDALMAGTVANADEEDFSNEEALEELLERNQDRLREDVEARCRGQAPRVVAKSLGIPPHAWRSKRGLPEKEMVAMLTAARDLFGPWKTKIADEPGALTVDAEHAGPLKSWLVEGEMVGRRPTPHGDLVGVRREGCDFLWTEAGGDLTVYGWRSPPQAGAPEGIAIN